MKRTSGGSSPLSDRGLSLLEMLVVLGIVSVILGAMMSMLSTLHKERRAGQEAISKNELYLNASKSLASNTACLASIPAASRVFNASNVTGELNPRIVIPRIPLIVGSNLNVAETGASFSPTSPWLRVQEIHLTRFQSTGVANYYKGVFRIVLDPTEMVRSLAAIEIPVLIQTNAATPPNAKQIIGCGMSEEWRQGEHCGAYAAGDEIATGVILCMGMNPHDGCPPGFTKIGGDYQSPGNRFFETCIKN